MRTQDLKRTILRLAGQTEFYGYEMHKKLENNKINVGIGRLYSTLAEMKDDGYLIDRWEKSQSGPRRRLYRTGEKGLEAREMILRDAIRTVHEFYTEYLLSLPPELSVFNTMSDLLAMDLPQNANIAYTASRFSGPVRKLIVSLQNNIPEGSLYVIHPRENNSNLEIDNVSILDGTFEDIPMKDNYLDLLILTGNIRSDCLDSCLSEWQRVVKENGSVAIITPTATIADYKDPLEIGEFIEQREHPRLESAESLNLEILSLEMAKYFERVDVEKVIHITVIRGFNPLK